MAETYSSNLQLTLIGTGDLAGSWGGVVNNNIGSGLETAITGYYNVVYASADQQVYINNNQFSNTGGASSSNGRNIYFYCSGTNPSSQYLYVPANQKLYIVNNATSAGVLVVSNGSIGSPTGTNVTVPNGTILLVYNDGTNINLVGASQLQSGSFTGTLTGFTSPPSPSFRWSISGDIVHLTCTSNSAAISNATTMTLTNLPSAIQPTNGQVIISDGFTDNGNNVVGETYVASGSPTVTFYLLSTTAVTNRLQGLTAFTATGLKGIGTTFSIMYSLRN